MASAHQRAAQMLAAAADLLDQGQIVNRLSIAVTAIAVAILERCTGDTTFAAIVDDLAKTFSAPRDRVQADVTALLRSLADKKLLEL